MNSRPFEEPDLPEISKWFADIEWPLPPTPNILPPLGVVVEDAGLLMACGWLYTTRTSLAFLSWTATNPGLSQEIQSAAMDKLIVSIQDSVTRSAPEIKSIMVLSKSGPFVNRLKKLGFRSKAGFDLCTWIVKS